MLALDGTLGPWEPWSLTSSLAAEADEVGLRVWVKAGACLWQDRDKAQFCWVSLHVPSTDTFILGSQTGSGKCSPHPTPQTSSFLQPHKTQVFLSFSSPSEYNDEETKRSNEFVTAWREKWQMAGRGVGKPRLRTKQGTSVVFSPWVSNSLVLLYLLHWLWFFCSFLIHRKQLWVFGQGKKKN